jgi:ABC-type antimicrobial peptide transport system permease subunit
VHEATTETPLTIIGVSGNVVYDWTDNAPERVIYFPFSQRAGTHALLAIRSNEDTSTLVPEIRSKMAQVDPDLPLSNIKRLDRLMLESLAGLFQIERLLSGFGLLALLLATTGVYGMASYTASLRKHEVGIRMAVGADRRDVLRLMIVQTMRLLFWGIAIGSLGAIALGRVIEGFFFGASAANPLSFVSACGLLCLSGLLATVGPAWRSTKVDPVVTLRS